MKTWTIEGETVTHQQVLDMLLKAEEHLKMAQGILMVALGSLPDDYPNLKTLTLALGSAADRCDWPRRISEKVREIL